MAVSILENPINVTVSVPGPQGAKGAAGTSISNIISGVSISGGVSFTGEFNILAGSNITLSQAGNSLTITAASTSADISGLATSGYVNTTSGSINERINNISISNAVYTSGEQTISGLKTFNSGISVYHISGGNRGLIDNNNIISIDWTGRKLLTSSATVFDWSNGNINDSTNSNAILINSRVLVGAGGTYPVEWGNRLLRDDSDVITVSWDDKILSGNWKTNNLFIEGGSSNELTSAIKFVNEGNQHYTIGQSGSSFLLANTSDLGNSIWGSSPIPLIFVNEFNNIGVSNTSPIGKLDVSGNIFASGGKVLTSLDSGNLQTQITSINNGTGNFYLKSNPNNFISSGDVIHRKWVTGIHIAGGAGLTGNVLFSPGNGIGLGQSAVGITISSTVPIEQTGTALQNQISTERNKNTLSGVSISGGISITGALNITAGSNITLTQAGTNSFSIASSAGGGGSSTNGVTGIIVTGVVISGAVTFVAGEGIEVTRSANTITISTPIAETGGSVLNGQLLIGASGDNSYIQGDLYASTGMYVISGSGTLGIAINNNVVITGKEQVFKTSIASGVDSAVITFPTAFTARPFIFNNLEISGYSPNSPIIYGYNISGITTTNYTIIFTDVISDTGVFLHTLAKLV